MFYRRIERVAGDRCFAWHHMFFSSSCFPFFCRNNFSTAMNESSDLCGKRRNTQKTNKSKFVVCINKAWRKAAQIRHDISFILDAEDSLDSFMPL